MSELLEWISGILKSFFTWRFWLCFMIAFAIAMTLYSFSMDRATRDVSALLLMIAGAVAGWLWNWLGAGNKIP